MGQKSVAMLLMIVTAAHDLGDNRPLIIDQPEDDLDNIYIYSSLVKEFRKIKNRRQLIFATHNPIFRYQEMRKHNYPESTVKWLC